MSNHEQEAIIQASLVVADTVLSAREALDQENNYDRAEDPEGHIVSILVALHHHCDCMGIDWAAEFCRANNTYLDDTLPEFRALPNESDYEGIHRDPEIGQFEVYYYCPGDDTAGAEELTGWHWRLYPDGGDSTGPFATSLEAYENARGY